MNEEDRAGGEIAERGRQQIRKMGLALGNWFGVGSRWIILNQGVSLSYLH